MKKMYQENGSGGAGDGPTAGMNMPDGTTMEDFMSKMKNTPGMEDMMANMAKNIKIDEVD